MQEHTTVDIHIDDVVPEPDRIAITKAFNGKTFKLLAMAVAAILSGKAIEFVGPNADVMNAKAAAIAAAVKQDKSAPAPTVVEGSQLFSALEFGKISRFLRRREPIWLGKPRPQNYAKQIANSRRK